MTRDASTDAVRKFKVGDLLMPGTFGSWSDHYIGDIGCVVAVGNDMIYVNWRRNGRDWHQNDPSYFKFAEDHIITKVLDKYK